ncbi:hypothetical protein HFD88_008049 [Aspergillus terreus]|nr:hypothetical protein HFD88_008049 [Aspergillus terreus]
MASSWIPEHDPRKPIHEKADDVVRRYYNIPRPSPVLQEILNDFDKASLLLDALRRHIALVKCRSQTLEDAQVTIYDKALLALTKNGEDPSEIGALELYLTEFLGIVPILPVSQSHEVVSKHLELQSALDKVLALDPIPYEGEDAPRKANNPIDMHQSATNTHGAKDHHYRSHRHHDREDRHKGEDSHDGKLQTRVERLLSVYHQAKSEFYGAMQRDGMVNIGMARFLRDSAENALRYMLDNGLNDHAYITELEMVFKQARDKAAELLGGRKRHFDEGRGRRRHRKKGRRVIDSYRPHEKRG